jgi:cytochrome b subunit of formate dehydrogenase
VDVKVWLAAAVVQGAVVLIAGWVIWRRGVRSVLLAAILIAAGLLILAANILWVATGGPVGTSPIGMRGGMPGLWLSNLTAVELLGLALLALSGPRR